MSLMVQWRLEPIMETGGSMSLVLKDESWTDVLGVKGLDFTNVQFDVAWEGDTLDSLDITVRGTLTLSSTGTIVVQGSYSKEDVDLIMTEEIYNDLFGAQLPPVDAAHDVTFKDLKLVIDRASGLVLEGEATVNRYTSAPATISLTSVRLDTKGSKYGDVVLDGGAVTKKTALDVFRTPEFNAGPFVENLPGGGEAQWTVYGAMKGDLQLQLSHLAPTLKRHPWLDIDIVQYAIKGVQVFATLQKEIIAVNGVIKTMSGGLTLRVAEDGESLKVENSLPQEQKTFPETGIPYKLDLGGEIAVGGADAKTSSPSNNWKHRRRGLLFYLLPSPSPITAEHNEVLKLKDVFLYFSTGATIAGVFRPPGISFDCTLDLFGHTAKINAIIAEQIAMSGSIDPFALGPVDNNIKLDGTIDLYALAIDISANVEVSPQPSFNFVAKIAFAEALEFDLIANISSELAEGGGTKGLDFDLTAEMHKEIIAHIVNTAQDHFIAADTAARNSYAEKEKVLDAKEASYKIKPQAAEDWVNAKKAEADAKRTAVNKAFDDRKAELEWEKGVKDRELQDTRQKLEDAVRKVQNELEQIKADVAKAVQEAMVAVETAAREGEAKIEG
ncbi:hypothetical protein P167DRAFT_579834 [Morchella conica CCBAS932]|uniref:Uncharacterized protein n=1 Tax=Morchella conica CCBAS932 TaxID=1392247 RepID=A0A3N4K8T3_9PEZI|nr:hypothetical protein P167DRAFT_579834 [Morchella conica CCBAS932]